MATQSVTIAQDNTSDTTWRAWVNGLKSAIDALGVLAQTSDTGQYNPATSTKAGGAYLIYRFTDGLQSTAPCFIRIDVTSGPTLQVTVGTGTNGAGSLAGFNNAQNSAFLLTNTATAKLYKLSGTTSRFTLWAEVDGGRASAISIERPHDNVGTEIGTCLLFASATATSNQVLTVMQGSRMPTSIGVLHWGFACPYSNQPTLLPTAGAVQRTAFTLNLLGPNWQVQNPMIGLLVYWPADLPVNRPLPPITLYGVAHSYINPAQTPGNVVDGLGGALLMCYE